MEIDIIVAHLILSIILFFIMNWIGVKSYSVGYMPISIHVKEESAPFFNFLLIILGPLIYIIIISTLLYSIKLDRYVDKIYLVCIYYVFFRLLFNIILLNRMLLLNWFRQILYVALVSLGSFFLYEKIIKIKQNILPDSTTLINEIWIIILVYLYYILNTIKFSTKGEEKRKDKYISNRYINFKNKFGEKIKEELKNKKIEPLLYAIMIYEDFNRPRGIRFFENISFYLTRKKHTLGLMQIATQKYIDDIESLRLAIIKIEQSYMTAMENVEHIEREYQRHENMTYFVLQNYNLSSSYIREVQMLEQEIINKFYIAPTK